MCDRGNSNNTTEKTLSPHSLLVPLCLNIYILYISIAIEHSCAGNCDRSDAINDKSRFRKWRSGTNSPAKRISNGSRLYNAITVYIYIYINVVNIKCAYTVYMITHVSAVASEMSCVFCVHKKIPKQHFVLKSKTLKTRTTLKKGFRKQ